MTPDELREAVARALCAADGYDPDSAPALHPTAARWRSYLDSADAALRVVREAMREPTHEMQWAGSAHTVGNISLFLKVWNAAFAASPLGGSGHE